jgi:hypothetical protein
MSFSPSIVLQTRVVRLHRKIETRNEGMESLRRPVFFPENAKVGEKTASANIYHRHALPWGVAGFLRSHLIMRSSFFTRVEAG